MSKITDAKDIRIEDYLQYPELKIPAFQREYVWGAEEIEEFWNDLVEGDVNFLGSIILKDDHYNHDTHSGYLDIVDGQQRTISLLLMLASLSRKLSELAGSRRVSHEANAEAHADEIRRLISRRDRTDLTRTLSYKLSLPSSEYNQEFKKVLDGEVSTRLKRNFKNFYEARKQIDDYFASHIAKIKSKKKRIDALIKIKLRLLDIKIIEILVPTDDDAYVIFETVNARGAELAGAELLKNFLFTTIENKNDVQIEWDNIKKTLTDIDRRALDPTGFIRYYWIGKYDHVSKKGLYRAIKKTTISTARPRVLPQTILNELSNFRKSLERIFLEGLDDWTTHFKASDRQEQRKAVEWFNYKKNLTDFPKTI